VHCLSGEHTPPVGGPTVFSVKSIQKFIKIAVYSHFSVINLFKRIENPNHSGPEGEIYEDI
jgi:hypothetical protein